MAAYLLEKRASFPCQIALFECCGRLGGKIITTQFDSVPGIRYEAGAAEFYDYSRLGPDPLRELIAELGLPTSPMQSGGAIFRDRIIRDLGDLRREIGAGTWRAMARFEQEARSLISQSDYYESDWRKDNDEPINRQTFHELIGAVPDEAARDYIRIMAHSDLACEPHQTSASYGLQNYLMDEPDYMRLYSIDGGNERLIQELARRIGARVLLQQPVIRVERGPGGTYLVTSINHGRVHTEEFDYVIVALPNDSIPAITWGGEVLRNAMDRHHQFYDHPAHYLRVTALFGRPFWRDQMSGSFFMSEAFGGCCLYDESSRFECGGMGVLGWLIAGEAALRLGNMADETLINHVVRSLPAVLQPGIAPVLEGQVQRWAGAVNALPGGFPAREPDSRHQPEPKDHPGLFVMGDYLFDSTINGVLDSADTVTDWIVEEEKPEPAAIQPLETTLTE
jgi:monoamine oxidase